MEYLRLFEWYHNNKRDLPFRKTSDPYHIWVSEVMLQQTQVETMLPYFDKFLEKFPSIIKLADATLDEILNVVQGIGYYKRFRLLKKGSEYVRDNFNGKLPNNYKELLKIPGVGAYTAGAISSIAFNLPHAATDGNVIRVLSRVYELDDDFRIEKNRKKLDKFNTELIEKSPNYNDYTQSVMELGATVCRPLNPKCEICPLNNICGALKNNSISKFPYLSPLKKQKEIEYVSVILMYEDKYLMRKRQEELLHNLYEFMQIETDSINYVMNSLEDLDLNPVFVEELSEVKHVFTHLIWRIKPIIVRVNRVPNEFVIIENFNDIAISTAIKKIIKQL